jgi:predicted nucleic acid-binding protein
MSAEVLLDTNVLVYSFDTDEDEKCAQARELLTALLASGRAAVSAQVLGEYYSVMLRRFSHRLSPRQAADTAAAWAEVMATYDTSLAVVVEAFRGVVRHQMPYYDAQIWAVARLHQIPLVLSEDFADGSVVEGVRFSNPFAEGFELEAALS